MVMEGTNETTNKEHIYRRQCKKASKKSAAHIINKDWAHISPHVQIERRFGHQHGMLRSFTTLGVAYVLMTITTNNAVMWMAQQRDTILQHIDTEMVRQRIPREVIAQIKRHYSEEHTHTLTCPQRINPRVILVYKGQDAPHQGQIHIEIQTQRFIKDGHLIGDLTHGSQQISPQEHMQSATNNACTFLMENSSDPVFIMQTKDSDITWHIRHDAQPNCKILEDGCIVATQDINPGETLTANTEGMSGSPGMTAILGGEGDDTKHATKGIIQAHWDALRRWHTQEPHSQLWQTIKELGQQADTYVQLGQLQAHTNSGDLPNILDLVTTDTKGDTKQLYSNLQQCTTEGHEDLGKAMQYAWQLIRQNEEIRKDILTKARTAIKDNTDEQQSTLETTNINNQDTAFQWRALYVSIHGNNKAPIFTNRAMYYRFHLALSYEEEKIERAQQPEHTIKDATLRWQEDENTSKCGINIEVPSNQLGRGRADPTPDSELRIKVKGDGDIIYMATGMIKSMEPKAGERSTTIIKAEINKACKQMINADTGDITPIWRSPTAMRQRRALQHMWEQESPEHEYKRKMLMKERDSLEHTDFDCSKQSIHSLQGLEEEWAQQDKHQTPTPTQQQVFKHVMKHRITCVQGPPGSGKTATAIRICSRFAYQNNANSTGKRVMILTPSNRTAEDMVQALKGIIFPSGSPLKVCWVVARSWENNIHREEVKPYTLLNSSIHPPEGYDTKASRLQRHKLAQLHNKRAKGNLAQNEEDQYHQQIREAMKQTLKSADVIVMTTAQAGLKAVMQLQNSLTILDETGQVTELNLNMVLDIRSDNVLFIGDQQQLEARQVAPIAEKLKICSAFTRLNEMYPAIMLEHIWRNHSGSIAYNNEHFYEGRLQHNEQREQVLMKQTAALNIFNRPDKPTAWINIEGKEMKREGHSWRNVEEVEMCGKIAREAMETGGLRPSQIAILSMYAGQVAELSNAFKAQEALKDIEICTVDSSQGKEWDLVIISAVRTRQGPRGFCTIGNRINVLTTRHRLGVIIVGHHNMRTAEAHWPEIIKDYEQGGIKEDNIIMTPLTGTPPMGGQITTNARKCNPCPFAPQYDRACSCIQDLPYVEPKQNCGMIAYIIDYDEMDRCLRQDITPQQRYVGDPRQMWRALLQRHDWEAWRLINQEWWTQTHAPNPKEGEEEGRTRRSIWGAQTHAPRATEKEAFDRRKVLGVLPEKWSLQMLKPNPRLKEEMNSRNLGISNIPTEIEEESKYTCYLATMLAIMYKQRHLRAWAIEQGNPAHPDPRDMQELSELGEAMIQSELAKEENLKSSTQHIWKEMERDTTTKHQARAERVLTTLLESEWTYKNPLLIGRWLTHLFNKDAQHRMLQSYCTGQNRSSPTLINIKREQEMNKEITDNRHRIEFIGCQIQGLRRHMDLEDAGPDEKRTNRHRIRVLNAELRQIMSRLRGCVYWQRSSKMACKILQEGLETHEDQEGRNIWHKAMCHLDKAQQDNPGWYYTTEGQQKLRTYIQQKTGSPHCRLLLQMLKKQPEEQTNKRRMQQPHHWHTPAEMNRRLQICLEQFHIDVLHTEGLNFKHALTGEPFRWRHPNPASTRHCTNAHGKDGTGQYTTGRHLENTHHTRNMPSVEDICMLEQNMTHTTVELHIHEQHIGTDNVSYEECKVHTTDIALSAPMVAACEWRVHMHSHDDMQHMTQNMVVQHWRKGNPTIARYTEQWCPPNPGPFKDEWTCDHTDTKCGNGVLWWGCLWTQETIIKPTPEDERYMREIGSPSGNLPATRGSICPPEGKEIILRHMHWGPTGIRYTQTIQTKAATQTGRQLMEDWIKTTNDKDKRDTTDMAQHHTTQILNITEDIKGGKLHGTLAQLEGKGTIAQQEPLRNEETLDTLDKGQAAYAHPSEQETRQSERQLENEETLTQDDLNEEQEATRTDNLDKEQQDAHASPVQEETYVDKGPLEGNEGALAHEDPNEERQDTCTSLHQEGTGQGEGPLEDEETLTQDDLAIEEEDTAMDQEVGDLTKGEMMKLATAMVHLCKEGSGNRFMILRKTTHKQMKQRKQLTQEDLQRHWQDILLSNQDGLDKINKWKDQNQRHRSFRRFIKRAIKTPGQSTTEIARQFHKLLGQQGYQHT